ncbi:MAG: hypothetical protein ACUVQ5_05405 [Candidatus Methanomethylicaceae archaeon]
MSKGISEIVATLIMIVLVSGAGMALYVYSMGYFTITTSALGEANRLNVNSLRERFTIVDVLFSVGGGETEVSTAVYNYGKTSVTLRAMFINGTAVAVPEPIEVAPGDLAWFNGSLPVALSTGSLVYVRVVSGLGNFYEALVVS